MKMSRIQCYFVYFVLFVIQITVHGHDSKFELNFDTIKRMYSFKQNLNISNTLDEMVMYNSTENHHCINELIAIANGLASNDEWAIQSM